MIDRASANDLMQRAADVGPVPQQIAGVLVLDAGASFDAEATARELAHRLATVPRLRQILRPAPLFCGRRYWTDAPGFDPNRHAHVCHAGGGGGDAELHALAVAAATQQLPPMAPPWAVTVIEGLHDGRAAVVVVVNHVLADGAGALALLQAMAQPRLSQAVAPQPPPSTAQLATDAWRHRAGVVRKLPDALRRAGRAARELHRAPPPHAPRTDLNLPTGNRRAIAVAQSDLEALRRGAHSRGATINDALLTGVTAALGSALRRRGDDTEELSVSIPVSLRSDSTAGLGNRVGVMPVVLPAPPADSSTADHLQSVVDRVHARKQLATGGTAFAVEPSFRLLRTLGVMGWCMDHQRMINTVVSNVAGPPRPFELLGRPVTQLIPISGVYGNVPVGFTALSYAGQLVVTVMVDPDVVPELHWITAELQQTLDEIEALSA